MKNKFMIMLLLAIYLILIPSALTFAKNYGYIPRPENKIEVDFGEDSESLTRRQKVNIENTMSDKRNHYDFPKRCMAGHDTATLYFTEISDSVYAPDSMYEYKFFEVSACSRCNYVNYHILASVYSF